jgi:hypothetical protein
VLRQGIQGISELITVPALINLDFADVRTIMSEGGAALMAVGRADGDDRARRAAEAAISSALLDVTIDGARGILFNITGGPSLSLFEVNEAAQLIKQSAHPEVNLIFGAQLDESMGDEVRVTVIATGFEQSRIKNRPDVQAARPVGRGEQRPQPAAQQPPALPRCSSTAAPANSLCRRPPPRPRRLRLRLRRALRRRWMPAARGCTRTRTSRSRRSCAGAASSRPSSDKSSRRGPRGPVCIFRRRRPCIRT